ARATRQRVDKTWGWVDPTRPRALMESGRRGLASNSARVSIPTRLASRTAAGCRIARGKIAFPADAPKPRVSRLVGRAWTTPVPVGSPAVVGFVAFSSRDPSGP